MRFVLITVIVLYLVLAFIGCLDRQMAVHSAGGKEIDEDRHEIDCRGDAGAGGNGSGMVGSRMAASRDSSLCALDRFRPDP